MFTPEERIKNIQNYAAIKQKEKEQAFSEIISLSDKIHIRLKELEPRVRALGAVYQACAAANLEKDLYRNYLHESKLLTFGISADDTTDYSVFVNYITPMNTTPFDMLDFSTFDSERLKLVTNLSTFNAESEMKFFNDILYILNKFDTFETRFYEEVDLLTAHLKSVDELEQD